METTNKYLTTDDGPDFVTALNIDMEKGFGDQLDFVDLVVNMTLSPSYIGNFRVGVEESLNSCLMRYREDLKGVIVCYQKDKVKLMQRAGKIVDETPDIHFNVSVQALVFRPLPGMELVGTVNKVGTGYVSMLVGGIFNASISGTNMQRGYTYDGNKNKWLTLSDDTEIALGSRLRFEVDRIHVAAGLVSISGALITPRKRKDSSASTSKKKKKKRKISLGAE